MTGWKGENIPTITTFRDGDPRRISAPPSQDFNRQLRLSDSVSNLFTLPSTLKTRHFKTITWIS
jgi:hypothetical protein